MEKEFVPYELVVKLKELGFDDECFSYYDLNNKPNFFGFDNLMDTHCVQVNRPTFSQAFRWIRENYNLHSHISLGISDEQDRSGLEYDEYIYIIEGLNGLGYDNYKESPFYNTYEEAELECLKKLIEIVESKSE